MVTVAIPATAAFNASSYNPDYTSARTGTGLLKSSVLWVGQYKNGATYELSQAFLGFDLTAIPANATITSATLRLTVAEGYGNFDLQVKKHSWASETTSAWVPGESLGGKVTLGSDLSPETPAVHNIGLTGIVPGAVNQMVLASEDTRVGMAPTADDTIMIASGSVYLDVVYTTPSTTVTYQITDTADDVAERSLSGSPAGMYDFYVPSGFDGARLYWAGIRFIGVAVPNGATITSATLTLKSPESASAGTWGVIKGVNSDNAPAWTTTGPLTASKTTQSKTIVDGATQAYDVAAIVQAIVGRAGWSSGGALAFVSDPTGSTGLMSWVDYDASSTDCAQLSITYTTGGGAPAPTLNTLTTTPTFLKVPVDAPVGTVIATISGQTAGSTLSDNAAEFDLVGNELRVAGSLDLAYEMGIFGFGVVETLAGATNSPKTTGFGVTVTAPRICEFIGQATGTTTATMPAHQAGDWIFCLSVRDGSTTAPAAPTGQNWSEANSGGASAIASRLNYKVARNSSEVVGTFSNTTSVIVLVYRPVAGYALSLGTVVAQQGATANITYPGLTLQDTSGTSIVLAFGAHRSTNTTLETPPTGMVLRSTVVDTTDEAAAFDTDGGVKSWSAKTRASGGSTAGWRTIVAEIKGTYASSTSPRKAPRYSSWL